MFGELESVRTHYGTTIISDKSLTYMEKRELIASAADRLTIRNPRAEQFARDLSELIKKYNAQ